MEVRCRRADVEAWSSGALEVRSRRARGFERWRCAAGVQTCRRGGTEFGSSRDALQRADSTVWSSGGGLQACQRRGMELWTRDIGVWIWR